MHINSPNVLHGPENTVSGPLTIRSEQHGVVSLEYNCVTLIACEEYDVRFKNPQIQYARLEIYKVMVTSRWPKLYILGNVWDISYLNEAPSLPLNTQNLIGLADCFHILMLSFYPDRNGTSSRITTFAKMSCRQLPGVEELHLNENDYHESRI